MTATDTGALLRCPFCGNDVSDDEGCYPINRDRTQWEVRCGNPTCYAHSPEDYSREHAIARWNRRAPNDELDAARNQLIYAEAALAGETAQREHYSAYGITHNGMLLYCSSGMRDAYSELRVELDAARARIAELEAWQPIETAPKDGSLFLCWVSAERWSQEDGGGSGRGADVSDFDFAQWRSMDDHPEGGYFMNMAGQIGDAQDITHWKALTPPVAAIARDGEG